MIKNLERGAGILLPISSLPSSFGIGTFGKAAYTFINQLEKAKQSYWQVLPLGPTSFGDSPYQSFSAFAGNPYFIDLDILCEEGLLVREEIEKLDWGEDEEFVSYEKLWDHRFRVLKEAFKKSNFKKEEAFKEFLKENEEWINDYALFMACKTYFNQQEWLVWDEDIRYRKESALKKYRKLLKEDIDFWMFIQYKFHEQWNKLKTYANNHGVKIIGDIPIYVALDSVDVWANPELYQLDEERRPVNVAGCPPDAFSDDGQKWGNPIYNWERMEEDGFLWWKKRMAASSKLYDVIRIDHFIGIVRYYAIPVNETARVGTFHKGPGMKLINAIDTVIGESKVIAEDLGVVVPEVGKVLKESGYPGMKVLEFAFDGDRKNEFLPHMYEKNCVVYGGTHDNEMLETFYDNLPKKELAFAMNYCGVSKRKDLVRGVIKTAYLSVADTVIFQMQDLLQKGNEARMNLPATLGTNWKWRVKEGEFSDEIIEWLADLSETYGRHQVKKRKEEKMLKNIVKDRFDKSIEECSNQELFVALLEMTKKMAEDKVSDAGKKKLYYISAEFLIGKLLSNNLINLGIYDEVNAILKENGKSLAEIEECELEPSLGNGGLGRLAACFLDSIATLGLNGDGVGLNYHLGLFKQVFKNNLQNETVNPWIEKESWLTKQEKSYEVEFKDFTIKSTLYDIDVTGYHNRTNKLHLFDVDSVDEGIVSEGIKFDKEEIKKNLTLFLYPDDSDEYGLLLRVYQQYFMVSNAAQLILDECIAKGSNLHDLPEYACIQINDTHPTMVIPELIRLLVKKGIDMEEAIEIVSKTCAYTNHTILAEALEKWPLSYLEKVAPSIVPIIKVLDQKIRNSIKDESVYIIDEQQRVHMAHMAIHYGYSTNGVAYLHTEILKNNELNNFYKLYPERFNNKTNGITFRRWLLHCNHALTAYLEELIGDGFKKDAMELTKLQEFLDDKDVLQKLMDIKLENKKNLKDYIARTQGITIDENSIYDVQVKRLHEYKRQQMNALYAIHKYLEIKAGKKPTTPITMIFGAKAAPAYVIAKDIIHLILCLQTLINNDPEVSPYLKVVMLENYNVTKAEKVIPACDLSEQISLASKEASGTGNMKFMLNGALTIGTMDGANVEIHDLVGDENIYIFGEDSETVINRYERGDYCSLDYIIEDEDIKKAVDFIISKELMAIGNKENLSRLYKELLRKDWFMTFPDMKDYFNTKEKAYSDYVDRMAWARKALVNISKAGFFSSDRTIAEYNADLWKLN